MEVISFWKPASLSYDPAVQTPIDPARLAEIYSRTAAFYDEVVAEQQSAARAIALEMLDRRPAEAFLEVGVGTGRAFARVVGAPGASRAAGLDIAAGMIDVARQRLIGAGLATGGLVIGDASRMPFLSGSFDCVLCTYTLEVLPEPMIQAVLLETRRVLSAAGRMVVAGLTEGEGADAVATEDWQRRFDKDPENFGGARPLMLSPLLDAAGFVVQERRYSGHGAGWPAEILLATLPGRGTHFGA